MTTLGLMTHRILTPHRYTHYTREAARLGFASTLLFTPHDVDLGRRSVNAYQFKEHGWSRKRCGLPDITHDVGFYLDALTIRKVKTIKAVQGVLPFTGYGLGHKWQIHLTLQNTEYAHYLPETKLMHTSSEAIGMAQRYGAVMVKPRNGKQGKGIVKIRCRSGTPSAFEWREGSVPGEMLPLELLSARLRKRFHSGEALVQRWMDIRCPKGGVFDIRALVQKDEGGDWSLTEMAVRRSGQGRIASNVSGGGTAWDVPSFLTSLYGEGRAERIHAECRKIAMGLPHTLEECYRKRFAELGIDLAVERGGHVRLIEVNIKPGKKIVRALSGEKAYADAMYRPIRYAKWLSDRHDSLEKGL